MVSRYTAPRSSHGSSRETKSDGDGVTLRVFALMVVIILWTGISKAPVA